MPWIWPHSLRLADSLPHTLAGWFGLFLVWAFVAFAAFAAFAALLNRLCARRRVRLRRLWLGRTGAAPKPVTVTGVRTLPASVLNISQSQGQ